MKKILLFLIFLTGILAQSVAVTEITPTNLKEAVFYSRNVYNNVVFVGNIDATSDRDGQKIQGAVNTIADAVTVANSLAPSSSNQITIFVVDGRTYTETLTLPNYVNLIGIGATFSGITAGSTSSSIVELSSVRTPEIEDIPNLLDSLASKLNIADSNKYITPYSFSLTLDDSTTSIRNKITEVNDSLTSHKEDYNNPHQATSKTVGDSLAKWNANKLQGDTLVLNKTDQYVIKWVASANRYELKPDETGGVPSASSVTTDTTNFTNVLSGKDTTVQRALETLDSNFANMSTASGWTLIEERWVDYQTTSGHNTEDFTWDRSLYDQVKFELRDVNQSSVGAITPVIQLMNSGTPITGSDYGIHTKYINIATVGSQTFTSQTQWYLYGFGSYGGNPPSATNYKGITGELIISKDFRSQTAVEGSKDVIYLQGELWCNNGSGGGYVDYTKGWVSGGYFGTTSVNGIRLTWEATNYHFYYGNIKYYGRKD